MLKSTESLLRDGRCYCEPASRPSLDAACGEKRRRREAIRCLRRARQQTGRAAPLLPIPAEVSTRPAAKASPTARPMVPSAVQPKRGGLPNKKWRIPKQKQGADLRAGRLRPPKTTSSPRRARASAPWPPAPAAAAAAPPPRPPLLRSDRPLPRPPRRRLCREWKRAPLLLMPQLPLQRRPRCARPQCAPRRRRPAGRKREGRALQQG